MSTLLSKFTFVAPASMLNKVACIKAIRTLTGIGLKEAKDASERVGLNQTFTIASMSGYANPAVEIENQIRILRSEGFQVGSPVNTLLEELRMIGSQALLQGEDELANEILQLVLAEKLRRGPELYQ
jgi:hypothetical protein